MGWNSRLPCFPPPLYPFPLLFSFFFSPLFFFFFSLPSFPSKKRRLNSGFSPVQPRLGLAPNPTARPPLTPVSPLALAASITWARVLSVWEVLLYGSIATLCGKARQFLFVL